jgi:hypothetical protein
VIAITFLSMFRTSRAGKRGPAAPASHTPPVEAGMTMDAFFWFLGPQQSSDAPVRGAITNTEPNRAMLVALFISVFVTAIVYASQKYGIKDDRPY